MLLILQLQNQLTASLKLIGSPLPGNRQQRS